MEHLASYEIELRKTVARIRREYMARVTPLIEELSSIALLREGRPVLRREDGSSWVYSGPWGTPDPSRPH